VPSANEAPTSSPLAIPVEIPRPMTDDQQRRHRDEDREPDGVLLGVDDAREPGVADPRPPQDAEHEQALRQARPGRLVGHERRALREREHEDEVEEELQRRDGLLLAHRCRQAARAAVGSLGAHRS